jgi:excisionase family DNA binding protein
MAKNERDLRPEALLSVKQVAVLDGCSEKTVRRAIAVGLLEVVRIGPGGRLVRIEPTAHLAYRLASRG